MDNDLYQSLGRIEGGLNGLTSALKEHMEQDTRRFTDVYSKIEAHAEDINQAKGAKAAVFVIATVAGTLASGVAWAIGKIFGAH